LAEAERARALVGARYGALSVVNDDGSIRAFITSGISDEERARIGAPPVGHGLLGSCCGKATACA
jgi:hypothetical protein